MTGLSGVISVEAQPTRSSGAFTSPVLAPLNTSEQRATPTIAKDQHTIDKVTLENTELKAVTRRDPTIVPRVWPVAEAFMAIILLDQLMMHIGYQAMWREE